MRLKYIHILFLLGIYAVSEVHGGKILEGIKKVYEDTKCGLHKLGNKIYQHEHDANPCEVEQDPGPNDIGKKTIEKGGAENKDLDHKLDEQPTTTNAQTSTSTSTNTPLIDIRAGDIQGKQNDTLQIEGRRLHVGANCPLGYRADHTGLCRLEY